MKKIRVAYYNSSVHGNIKKNKKQIIIKNKIDNNKNKSIITKTKMNNITKWVNDPSAGSPTKTLLRLLLPLSDQVRFTFSKTHIIRVE